MGILRKYRDIKSMEQLRAHLDRGNGSVPGQYWVLEEYDDGDQGELGIRGTYRTAVTDSDVQPGIVFEPSVDPAVLAELEVTDENLAFAAVKVLSRVGL